MSIPIGAHLVAKRGLYTHHGIYVGGDRVVHYNDPSGSTSKRRARISETSLETFANGDDVYIQKHADAAYLPDEIVSRARGRIGENNYDVAINNCEHFANWCVTGKAESPQGDRILVMVGGTTVCAGAAVAGYCAYKVGQTVGGAAIAKVAATAVGGKVAGTVATAVAAKAGLTVGTAAVGGGGILMATTGGAAAASGAVGTAATLSVAAPVLAVAAPVLAVAAPALIVAGGIAVFCSLFEDLFD